MLSFLPTFLEEELGEGLRDQSCFYRQKVVEQGEAYTQADPTGFYSVSLLKLIKGSKKGEITNMKDHWRSYGH